MAHQLHRDVTNERGAAIVCVQGGATDLTPEDFPGKSFQQCGEALGNGKGFLIRRRHPSACM